MLWFHISSNSPDHLVCATAMRNCAVRAQRGPAEASSPSLDMPQDPGMPHLIPSIFQDVKTFKQKHATFNFRLYTFSFILKNLTMVSTFVGCNSCAVTPDGWRAVRVAWGRINPPGCEGRRHSQAAQLALGIKTRRVILAGGTMRQAPFWN